MKTKFFAAALSALLILSGCGSSSSEFITTPSAGPPVAPAVMRLSLQGADPLQVDHLVVVGRGDDGSALFGPQQFDLHTPNKLEIHAPARLARLEVEGFARHGVRPLFDDSVDVGLQSGTETAVSIDATGQADGKVAVQALGKDILAQDASDSVDIDRMTTTPLPCAPQSDITATVLARSVDGLPLDYQWTSDWAIVGESTAASVELQAPGLPPGTDFQLGSATVVVTDSEGNTASGTVNLFSRAEAPVFEGLTFPVPIVGSSQLTAEVTDPQNSPLTFLWTLGGSRNFPGTIANASQWTWNPPGLPGLYRLVSKATNSSGLAAQGTALVQVVNPKWGGAGRDLQGSRRAPHATQFAAPPTVRWSASLGEGGPCSPVVSADGTVYVLNVDTSIQLHAIGPSGESQWTWQAPAVSGVNRSALSLGEDALYVVSGKLYVIGLDGTLRGQSQDEASFAPTITSDGSVITGGFALNGDPVLKAFRSDATLLWTTDSLAGEVFVGGAISSDPDGFLYVSTQDLAGNPNTDRRVALNAVSPIGTVRWTLTGPSLDNALDGTSPAVGPDGTIYIAASGRRSTRLYAVDRTGAVKWTQDLTGNGLERDTALTIAADGSVRVLSKVDSGHVLDTVSATGALLSTANLGGAERLNSPVMTSEGGVYVALQGGSGSVTAVAANGESRWTIPTAGAPLGDPVVGPDGTLYLALQDLETRVASVVALRP